MTQVTITILLIFAGLTFYYAADGGGIKCRQITATVVGFVDRWTMKRGHECVTELATGYGTARIFTFAMCHDAPWHIGDTAEIEARKMRLSGSVIVSTRGTIFNGARNGLPES